MSGIPNIGHSNPILPQGGNGKTPQTNDIANKPQRESDQVEFSQMSKLLSQLASIDVRQELIDQAKINIANGVYESEQVINDLVDTLMEELI